MTDYDAKANKITLCFLLAIVGMSLGAHVIWGMSRLLAHDALLGWWKSFLVGLLFLGAWGNLARVCRGISKDDSFTFFEALPFLRKGILPFAVPSAAVFWMYELTENRDNMVLSMLAIGLVSTVLIPLVIGFFAKFSTKTPNT